eukprot:2919452-Rhodomonas_salina.1
MLRASNAPRRLWPWVLTHRHCTYAYWAKSSGKSSWDSIPFHNFSQDPSRDLQQWGCYVTGHLSREHPL